MYSIQKPALTGVVRTWVLSHCGDDILADKGCLSTAAAETHVGLQLRMVPPSEAVNPMLGLQCGAWPASRAHPRSSGDSLGESLAPGPVALRSVRCGTKLTQLPLSTALADQFRARNAQPYRGTVIMECSSSEGPDGLRLYPRAGVVNREVNTIKRSGWDGSKLA